MSLSDRNLALMTYAFALGSRVTKLNIGDEIGAASDLMLAKMIADHAPPDALPSISDFTDRVNTSRS